MAATRPNPLPARDAGSAVPVGVARLVFLLAALLLPLAAPAQQNAPASQGTATKPLEPVVIQLRWLHQFQFAGYYAAVEKGYYREAGYEVTLVEGSPERSPIGEVLAGRAHYAEGNSEVLFARLQGEPIVALAVIFQHSPSVLLTRAESGLATPQDLVGRKVMLMGGTNDADLLAMFQNEGVGLGQIQRIDSSFNIEDLLNGKTDAFNAYATNEPFFMEKKGVPATVISPMTYGIDFYSDILFTTEQEVRKHPERVRAIRAATLRGWEYAMEHPGEIIDILLAEYGARKTREHLEFEAEAMRKLILPDLVQMGHMNPGRWQHMAETFVQVGMSEPDYSLDGFIYDPDPRPDYAWVRWVIGTAAGLLLCVAAFAVWNLQLRRMVHKQTSALSDSEEKYRTLLEHLPQKIVYKDRNFVYVSCNKNYAASLGVTPEDIPGKTDFDFHPRELAEEYRAGDRRVMESREVLDVEETYIEGGHERIIHTCKSPVIDERGNLAGVLVIFWDVTDNKRMEEERRALEAQVQHTQKLESLGILAGGIAHDFNNLLMAILGNADLALQDLSPVSPVRDNILEIDRASRRAADLCRQMLAYSGRGRFVLTHVNLTELVEEMAHMLEVSVSKKAVLRYDFARNLPCIEGDATQIRQVVMNLITNASDAIGDTSGLISIRTGLAERKDNGPNRRHPGEDLPEGEYVYIEVADTGCGMDEETQAKLFDPFFTTKFTGRGLGLSAVQGIVRGHHGAIQVDSRLGKGTTFRVLLPVAAGPAEPAGQDESAGTTPWRGDGVVLLVDDEQSVRVIGRQLLERLGFRVITADDGRDGVAVFRKQASDIVCVVLDLTMPNMDGKECFGELRRIKPDVRILLSSGYSEQEVGERFRDEGFTGFIQKPYRLSDLEAKMKAALHDAHAADSLPPAH